MSNLQKPEPNKPEVFTPRRTAFWILATTSAYFLYSGNLVGFFIFGIAALIPLLSKAKDVAKEKKK